jgi:cob(I)alamin adenosyltransferase
MAIYTRTGDKGQTSLYGGKRVSKSNLQVEAYGSVDELLSFIGLLIAKIKNKDDKTFLTSLQKDLYQIMSLLSGAEIKNFRLGERVKKIEKKIDSLSFRLPELHQFILPRGNEVSCLFHIARTVCRRAERHVAKLPITNYQLPIIKYLNRLSDLLFVFSRWYNRKEEIMIE